MPQARGLFYAPPSPNVNTFMRKVFIKLSNSIRRAEGRKCHNYCAPYLRRERNFANKVESVAHLKFKGDSLCPPLPFRGGLTLTHGIEDQQGIWHLEEGSDSFFITAKDSDPKWKSQSRADGFFPALLPLHKIKKTSAEMRRGEKEKREVRSH